MFICSTAPLVNILSVECRKQFWKTNPIPPKGPLRQGVLNVYEKLIKFRNRKKFPFELFYSNTNHGEGYILKDNYSFN